MKKNPLFLLFFALAVSCSTQSAQSEDILNTKSISKIEEYLQNAHPEDPKRIVLKSRLIALKNKEWTKGAATAKPMAARPILTESSLQFTKNFVSDNSEEFKNLMAETPSEHREKTIKLLNTMLDGDINRKEVILLFKNNSDCNLVLNIHGKKSYSLAVPAHNDNVIILEKDSYDFSGNLCKVKYASKKQIDRNIQIIIGYPERENAGSKLALNSDSNFSSEEKTSPKKSNLPKQRKNKTKF